MMSSRSPISQWGAGSKSKAGRSSDVRSTTFSSLVLADGHVVAGYVGQRQEEAVELLLDGACLGIQLLDAAADLPHLVDELGRLLLRGADLPAHLVAAGPEVVALVHHGPALTVQAENAVHVDVIAPQLDGAANAVCGRPV